MEVIPTVSAVVNGAETSLTVEEIVAMSEPELKAAGLFAEGGAGAGEAFRGGLEAEKNFKMDLTKAFRAREAVDAAVTTEKEATELLMERVEILQTPLTEDEQAELIRAAVEKLKPGTDPTRIKLAGWKAVADATAQRQAQAEILLKQAEELGTEVANAETKYRAALRVARASAVDLERSVGIFRGI